MEKSKKSLILYNPSSGDGSAEKTANSLKESLKDDGDFYIEVYDFIDYFGKIENYNPENDGNNLIEDIAHVFILGGDGSVFSFLKLLHNTALTNDITVTVLAAGGENILARKTGTNSGNYLDIVRNVLEGNAKKEVVKPLFFSVDENEKEVFFWSILAGFSREVLKEMENMRNMKYKKIKIHHKIKAVLASLKSYRKVLNSVPVEISVKNSSSSFYINDSKKLTVLDFGVVSKFLLEWTRYFSLPIDNEAVTVLQTLDPIGENENKLFFTAKLAYDIFLLYFGLNWKRFVLKHVSLYEGFEVTVNGNIAVDTEISKGTRHDGPTRIFTGGDESIDRKKGNVYLTSHQNQLVPFW